MSGRTPNPTTAEKPGATRAKNSSAVLSAPVAAAKGVGQRLSTVLAKLGITTVEDLLRHYPHRHEDRSRFVRIADLKDGETATIAGTVTAVENRPTKTRLVLTKVTVDDGSRALATLTWFNQWRTKQVFEKLIGQRIVAYGGVKRGFTSIEISQPEWEAIEAEAEGDSLAIGRIVPIYPLTEGIGQARLRRIVYTALEMYADVFPEPLPEPLRAARALPTIAAAIRAMHFPTDQNALEQGRRRLVYDELLAMQTLLAGRRLANKQGSGIEFAKIQEPISEFVAALPFELTGAQKRVIGEIAGDMAQSQPMNRLIQGDVGSGKTAVAMAAMLIAVRNGYQSAMMAPTEILAEQHHRSVQRTLESLGVRVALLTGSLAAKAKAAVTERIQTGEIDVIVGTHALIQENVSFARLGLAVIDEQHRFGVRQRATLTGKGESPDVLVMTATPIPRTLTLTVYGDLDVSIIDELPPGRKPIRTHWKRSTEKASIYEGVRRLLAEGRQAYVVCPLVEESEKLQVRAATELAAHLAKHTFPEFQIGLLHGQMGTDEKEAVMRGFRDNSLHVLVATTVIEVGVDVPNAAVMVIEDADRFGLAQLHQLRGRVGRGQHASFCVLIADPKSDDGAERMRVLTETNDGFRIAEEDLRLRGPGEFYGVRQSGLPSLRIADVLRDVEILKEARADAFALLARDPRLSLPEHAALRDAVIAQKHAIEARHGEDAHAVTVG